MGLGGQMVRPAVSGGRVRTELVLLLLLALVQRGSMQVGREKCMINFLDGCKLYTAFNGLNDDSGLLLQLQLLASWQHVCASCHTGRDSDSGIGNSAAAAYDSMGVGTSEARCLQRAQEYFEWCKNDLHQQVRLSFFTRARSCNTFSPFNSGGCILLSFQQTCAHRNGDLTYLLFC